ncbi:MAG: response regulator transcription factor [Eubacteriales bacterium]
MKILIIEDDNTIIENLALTFKVGWPEVCLIWTGLGEEGVDMVESESPDLIILDLGLPDISGFEVLKKIRLFSKIPILILTVREDETAIVKAFDLGVNEYILKPFRQMEILARLKSIARNNNIPHFNSFIKYGPFKFNPSTHTIKYNERTISLTKSEFLLLQHLAMNRSKIVTYSSIAETIWGTDYPGSEKAIRVYIRQLRKKIENNPEKPEVILTESKVGYYIK